MDKESLDAEVDHSFFDSDCEEKPDADGENSGTANKKNDQSNLERKVEDTGEAELKAVSKMCEEILSEEERTENEKAKLKKIPVEGDWEQPESVLFLSSITQSDHSDMSRRGSIRNRRIKRKVPAGIPRKGSDDDSYYLSDKVQNNEDEKERRKPRFMAKSAKRPGRFKKCTYDSSSSDTETEHSHTESDDYVSESSCSSSERNAPSSSLASPKKLSQLKVKSWQSNLRYAEESDNSVTDVTPLSTPDTSPIKSFEMPASKEKKKMKQINVSQDIYNVKIHERYSKTQREKSEIFTSRSRITLTSESSSLDSGDDHRRSQRILNDAMDLNQLLKAFMQLNKKEQKNLVIDYPSSKSRKNLSFSNEEVMRIDRENQRLLGELARQATKPRSKTPKKSSPQPVKLCHSAINRQREQKRIEQENLLLSFLICRSCL
ncbi:cilia- and flagella-associated protein 97 isoform X2 [Latimeria chalumnae]|uniref:cilia- and flagella-associated protein 97 isoform X2 n=1 Tax=Latimeria chalumnae TaxID=7897 RepID=UPI0003C1858B|nr:PREDICTED: cilia- and flagella-associated protein 97 isoform X2 [Latimeria chalumnae]|eukprot:XP_006011192.1 PREDICTED: cilia- and flagella-associated protein 97 isoform X2 [Latimeria chalumnae]